MSYLFNDDKTIQTHNIPNVDKLKSLNDHGIESISVDSYFNPFDLTDNDTNETGITNTIQGLFKNLLADVYKTNKIKESDDLKIQLKMSNKGQIQFDNKKVQTDIMDDPSNDYSITLKNGNVIVNGDFITSTHVKISTSIDINEKIKILFNEQIAYIQGVLTNER